MSRVIDLDGRKKIIALICATIVLILLLAPAQILAAEATTEAETEAMQTTKTYTVTYSAGRIAEFREDLVDDYIALIGTNGIVDVVQSEATGNIKITVEAMNPVPNAPDNTDIIFKEEFDGQYIVNTSWRQTETIVENNMVYVVDYDALIDSVEYTIKFVDADTGADVASPVITLGNIGDTVTYTAKTITDYVYDELIKEIDLTDISEDNVITFYYTNTAAAEVITNTVTLPGETITVPAAAVIIPATPVPAAAEDTTTIDEGAVAADDGTEVADGTTIEDENTPLDDGSDLTTILDDNIPLANEITTPNTVLLSVLLVIAAALIIIGIAFYNKKKKAE